MKKILANSAVCALLMSAAPIYAAIPAKKPVSASEKPMTGEIAENVETLDNGVVLLTRLDRIAPRVAVSILVQRGASDETADNAGWRRLVAGATLRNVPAGFAGADSSDDAALAIAAQNFGADIGITVGDDFIEYYGVGDSARLNQWMPLLIALWQKPILSDENLDKTRERQRAQVDAQDLDASQTTASALEAQLFRDSKGELLAYGLPLYGSEKSLDNLDNAKLRALHGELLNSKITVSMAGDVDSATAQELLSALPQVGTAPKIVPQFAALKKGQPAFVLREIPLPAATVVVSYPMGQISAADAPAFRVLTAMLTESRAARLPQRLLGAPLVPGAATAFSVSGQWISRVYGAELLLTAQTSTQNVDGVKNALIDEVRKLREGKITPAELQSAKNYVRGVWSIERQSPRERAFLLGQNHVLGFAPDAGWPSFIESVKIADINRVAKKYLGSYAVALIMPRGS